ncbi:MAG: two-component regulator propeller domain-containing protein, partial [Sulfuricaulis sp.]|nr:two-component regulator propeller domain-containing protein [Sulfuricaulis sp.]
MTSDRFGTIWVGASSGLFAWRNDQFEPHAPPNPSEPFPVQAVLASPTGGLWVASRGQVWFYTDERWAGPMGDWPDQTPPYARLVDSSGRLWLGPPQKGLWCFTPGGKTTQLGPETGIQADAMALFCDREGTMWVSVYRTGVARVRNRLFTSVKVTAGLHTTPLWNVTEDGAGAIWFSPEFKSPVRWREGEEKEFALPSSASESGMWTKAMTVDRSGAVWAAIYGAGILRAENDAFQPALPWPRQARFARALYQDKSTNWWLGSDSGLHSWSNNRWRQWDSAAGLPNVPVRAVTEDSFGRLWVATFGGGVARLDEGRFTRFNRRHGIPNNLIYTVHGGADGSVWIGTHGGLARARNGR